jgi:hypothetical protein
MNFVLTANMVWSVNPSVGARMEASAIQKQVNVIVQSDGLVQCAPIDVQPVFLVLSVVSIVSVTTELVATTKLVNASARQALWATSAWKRVRTQSSD